MSGPIGCPGPDWRLLDYDPLTDKTAWMRIDAEGNLTVRTFMDVEKMLEQNAEIRSHDDGRWKGEAHLVSRVPMHIWQRELAPAVQQDDQRYLSKWLNDPDHSKFRTKGGRV